MTDESPSFHHFLRSRRSIRSFHAKGIPDEVIERLLLTACQAPSAHNRQPWRFVVLVSMEDKQALALAMGVDYRKALRAEGLSEARVVKLERRSRGRILGAPVVVLVCLSLEGLDEYADPIRDEGEKIMAIQSVAMAGGMLLLAAHGEGLGAVWLCAPLFVPEVVQRTLNLPADWIPQGMVLLGYPAEDPPMKPRKSLHEVTRFL